MQSNQHHIHECQVITNEVWENILKLLLTTTTTSAKIKNNVIISKLNEISLIYNIDRKNMIKNFLNYIIRNHTEYINCNFLNFVEHITHIQECKTEYLLQYFVLKIITLL